MARARAAMVLAIGLAQAGIVSCSDASGSYEALAARRDQVRATVERDDASALQLAWQGDPAALDCVILGDRADLAYKLADPDERWPDDAREELLGDLYVRWRLSGEGMEEIEAMAGEMTRWQVLSGLRLYSYDPLVLAGCTDFDSCDFEAEHAERDRIVRLGQDVPKPGAEMSLAEGCPADDEWIRLSGLRDRARAGELAALDCEIGYLRRLDWEDYQDRTNQELVAALFARWSLTGEGLKEVEKLASQMPQEDIEFALLTTPYEFVVRPPQDRCERIVPGEPAAAIVELGHGERWNSECAAGGEPVPDAD